MPESPRHSHHASPENRRAHGRGVVPLVVVAVCSAALSLTMVVMIHPWDTSSPAAGTVPTAAVSAVEAVKVSDVAAEAEGVATTEAATPATTTKAVPTLDTIKMYADSFNHGVKPTANQKYIVLHDTEGDSSPQSVAQYWMGANQGAVASHFVVGKDGTIVQCGDVDEILHHAGWGGPGDYDELFGVGNDDGKGSGDDLVGVVNLAGYTSYGMNSYSIGVEMVHVAGEDYPEAQLEAVDRIIAYLDAYYGFASIIIDHKAWRPSNSDTDTNFAGYLANYQAHRTHA